MSTVASGVIMRIGEYDTSVYPDRTLRSVHPARRHESVTFRIESDDYGVHREDVYAALKWEHFKYRFIYQHQGRTLTVTWRCGTAYGSPKAIDGLRCAFMDAESIAWLSVEGWADEFGYDMDLPSERRRINRMYNACERMNDRLDFFFGDEREAWHKATAER